MSETRNIKLIKVKQSGNSLFVDSTKVFGKKFLHKSIIAVVTSLTEEVLKGQGYDAVQIERINNVIYLTLIALQGSLKTSGSAFVSREVLKYIGLSDDYSYWAGFAVGIAISLSRNFTPWGFASVAISTLGGQAGKWCTQWAYEKTKNYFSDVNENSNPERVAFQI